MKTSFKNPLNPLDLNVNNLNEIRVKFMELGEGQQSNKQFIKIEQLALMLSQYLKCEPSKMLKIIQRHSNQESIDWNSFLSIIDCEAGMREKLLELEMFDIKLRKFVTYEHKILKPLNRQTDRLYYIQRILPIEFCNK